MLARSPRALRLAPRLHRLLTAAATLALATLATACATSAPDTRPAGDAPSPKAEAPAPRTQPKPPARETITRLDGSTVDAATLTRRIEDIVQAADVHGLTVTVFNDAEIVYSRAFGHADRPNGRPLGLDTEIYGASLSKAVFAVLVLRLVEQGVLDLDTPLQAQVGEPLAVKHGPVWHQDWSGLRDDPRHEAITARMALSHTTGLPNWRWFEPDQKLRFAFDPGERYRYSGEGMVYLQIALEKLTEKPLEELMQEEVFRLYGMEVSSYRWQDHFEADYSLGHRVDGTTYPRDKDNDPRAPSTLETTTTDYARFLRGVLQGKGLSAPSWNDLFTPTIRIRSRTQFGPGSQQQTGANDAIELSYGLGWGLFKTPHGWAAFKEGNGSGFQNYSVLFPDQRLGVLLMSNSENAESAYHHLLIETLANPYTPLEWEGFVPFDRKAEPQSANP